MFNECLYISADIDTAKLYVQILPISLVCSFIKVFFLIKEVFIKVLIYM